MQHEQDQWYHEVDQEEYEPGGRYALSIQVRNLPSTWAKRGNRTKQTLLAMLQSCTSARLTNPSTGDNYLSRPKKDRKQYAYAFVSVYTEEEGNTFIQDVRNLVVEGEILEAKWSSKSFPSAPGECSQVININTGEVQQWHPLKGVKTPTRPGGSRSATPTPGMATQSRGSRWPQEAQQAYPPLDVNIAYTPSVHDCVVSQGCTSPSDHQDCQLARQDREVQTQQDQPQDDHIAGLEADRHQQGHQAVSLCILASSHGTNDDLQLVQARPRAEPWKPEDTVQAVLLDDGNILLTTYKCSDDTWVQACRVKSPQQGTIWDYQSRNPGQMWLARAQDATAGVVQEWIYSIGQDTWIGTPYVVTSPENVQVHRATHTSHHAFLQLRRGQHVTAISPPSWVWADRSRLAGLWCIAATTYNWDPNDNIFMSTNVRAGLVPMSVITRSQDL